MQPTASVPHSAPPATFTPNRNHDRRDEILGTRGVRYAGGVKHFAGLDVGGLAALIDEGFLDPAGRQNLSPSAGEFLQFLRRWPAARAHGYAVSRRREDYRVSVEGLECDTRAVPADALDKLRAEFERFCAAADEYEDRDGRLFAWWD